MSSATDAALTPPQAPPDIEALLAPLEGESPAGVDLQYDRLHDEIREARRADERLEQGEWKRMQKQADWGLVERLATAALAERTKDLRVAAWLAEALVKLYGFPGLRDGLRLLRGLLERYWDNLYPPVEEGDTEARANALAWANRQLVVAAQELPLTATHSGVNYNFFQFDGAKKYNIPEQGGGDESALNKLRELAAREGRITTEEWRKAKQATPRAFYEETCAVLDECWQEFVALDRTIDEKFGAQTPGLSALKRALDDIRTIAAQIAREKRLLEPDAVLDMTDDANETGGEPVAAPADAEGHTTELVAGEPSANAAAIAQTATTMAQTAGGHIRTREIALKRLAEIAVYFQQTEPHSPVSYLVQRAVRWGQMPLETWLQEVVKDGSVLGELRETLGLNRPDGSDVE